MVAAFKSPSLQEAMSARLLLQKSGLLPYVSGCKANGYEVLVADRVFSQASNLLKERVN